MGKRTIGKGILKIERWIRHNWWDVANHIAPLGKRSGVNLVAACMFPLIFIFPCMNAVWGFKVPWKRLNASESRRVKVASAFPCFPSWILPFPFFKSTVHHVPSFPLVYWISKWYVKPTLATASAPLSASIPFICSKTAVILRGISTSGKNIIMIS